MQPKRSIIAVMAIMVVLITEATSSGVHGVVSTRRAPTPKALHVIDAPVLAYGDTLWSEPINTMRYGSISVLVAANIPDEQWLRAAVHVRTDPSRDFAPMSGFDAGVSDRNRYFIWSGLSAPEAAIAVFHSGSGPDDITNIWVSVYLE